MRNGRLEKTFIAIAATGFATRSGILSHRTCPLFQLRFRTGEVPDGGVPTEALGDSGGITA